MLSPSAQKNNKNHVVDQYSQMTVSDNVRTGDVINEFNTIKNTTTCTLTQPQSQRRNKQLRLQQQQRL